MGHKKKAPSLDTTAQDGGFQEESDGAVSSAFSHLSFAEILEDLSSRFIVNLPAEELASIERICFQVEQAHWFYEDFLRPLNPSLTSFSLRRFSSYLLHTSSLTVPLIQRYISTSSSGKQNQQDLEAAFDEFMKYKTRVPVCGVVMLNRTWDKCVLVKGWKSSAAWGFPKGKINQQESERDCAVREVLEETGYDCGALLESDSGDFMELTMREQKIRLYIVPGVDEDTQFETLTRKEISRIAWFRLSDLPTWKKNRAPPQGMGGKFYLISPFIGKLKQWIQEKKHHRVDVANSIPTEPNSVQSGNAKGEDEFHSDDLKALLGLGKEESINLPTTSKGQQMIQKQGDARGQQLLDLLRGDSTAAAGANRDQSVIMDERERGTAALLAALNAGAGMRSEVPASSHSNSSATLLSMLNGSTSSSAVFGPSTIPPQSFETSSPMVAPKPQNISQAQSLLNLISPKDAIPLISHVDEARDEQRAKQRATLLDNLMASTTLVDVLPPHVDQSQRRVEDFRFPNAPPPALISSTQQRDNLLSMLQPENTQREAQHATLAPSPFSSFVQQQAIPTSTPQMTQPSNPLLALLNGNNSTAAPSIQPPSHPMHYQAPMLSSPPPASYMNYAPPLHNYTGYPVPPAHHQHYVIAPPPPPPPPQHFYHAPPGPLGHIYPGFAES